MGLSASAMAFVRALRSQGPAPVAVMFCIVFLAVVSSSMAFAPNAALFPSGLSLASQRLSAVRPHLRAAAAARTSPRMCEGETSAGVIVQAEGDVDEFFGVDKEGNPVRLTLAAKEKLYLDATSAFHNDGKSMMGDDEYDQLKLDLEFEGSPVGLMSRDEIKFMVAANRYAEGK